MAVGVGGGNCSKGLLRRGYVCNTYVIVLCFVHKYIVTQMGEI